MRNTVIAAAFGVLALAGCSTSTPAEPTASSAPVQPVSGVPTPDAGQQADYLAALKEIDPGLVVNEERAIRRGRAICDRIINKSGSAASLVSYTVEELSGGNATIDQAQAKKAIKAVKVWCEP
jgi:hypothetical protein